MNKILLFSTLALMVAGANANEVCNPPPLMKQAIERVKHFLNKNVESDEAYKAFHGDSNICHPIEKPTMTQEQLANLKAGSSDDYYHDMDYGITNPANQDQLLKEMSRYVPGLKSKEDAVQHVARGRNNWIVWTAGNDKFWNELTPSTLSGTDFLKTVSDEPSLPANHDNRWIKLGVVNEPCFTNATGPDPKHFGIWLDQRTNQGECAKGDPFANESNYPGIKIGSRGTDFDVIDKKTKKKTGQKVHFPVGSYYGEPTGIVGLRMFPNPDFDQAAFEKWDPVAYYNTPAYYNDPKLIRPYRIGMACAFCHVGPNPANPPKDFNNPQWANLSSNPGAQYYWFNRVFFWNFEKSSDNFLYQMVSTYRPGALDTSLMSSDQINNPRTMNAVYNLPARVVLAHRMNHRETLVGDEQLNAQFGPQLNEQFATAAAVSPQTGSSTDFLRPSNADHSTGSDWVLSPRVLKDGSDSVGALGALNRVFVNIGLFSEEWTMNFIPLIGGRKITPFRIDLANEKSLYWQATVSQTPDLALYFLVASRPDRWESLPEAKTFTNPAANMEHGKILFARNCAQCHSSKLPDKAYTFFNHPDDPKACLGPNYNKCWDNYWNTYARKPEFKDAMVSLLKDQGDHFIVHGKPGDSDFDPTDHNYLSTELRVPANLTDSNLCSPIATNAIKDNIWDNFASSTYKTLPSIGNFRAAVVTMEDGELTTKPVDEPVLDGGRGYVRPASLVSLWSSAPFLVNNSLGPFMESGTTADRMKSFQQSISMLLHPDQRAPILKANGQPAWPTEHKVSFTTNFGDRIDGTVDVTSKDTYIMLPKGYLPNSIYYLVQKYLQKYPLKTAMVSKDKINVVELEKIFRKGQKQRSVAQVAEDYKTFNQSDERPYTYSDSADVLPLGPIPAGVPINLISNINLEAKIGDLEGAISKLVEAMWNALHDPKQRTAQAFMNTAGDALLKVSKCNDFVVNRGHYFGTEYFHPAGEEKPKVGSTTLQRDNDLDVLSESDKADLIEYLKTM